MNQEQKIIQNNEVVLYKSKPSVKVCILSKLKSYLMYIIMWLLLNGFFLYLMFLQDIVEKYWFVALPFACFDIIGLLMTYTSIAKETSRIADIEYFLTDKAVYFCDNSQFKIVRKFTYEEIVKFEKDKYNSNMFYVYSKNDVITFEYMSNQTVFYAELAKRVNSRWRLYV